MKLRPLATSLVMAALSVCCSLWYMRELELSTSGGEPVSVLVAVRRIERGAPLTEAMLTTKSIPAAYVDERQIRAGEREKVLGLRAAEPVGVSQTLMWSDVLTTRDERRDLSALVQSGYRAITAPFTAMPTYAMIRPGDFVDVIATTADSPNGGETPRSRLLLQRVMVLAIGNTTADKGSDDSRSGPRTQPLLTLSLNLNDAQTLATAAGARDKLTVALRNPNDQRVNDSVSPEPRVMAALPRAREPKPEDADYPLELKRERRVGR